MVFDKHFQFKIHFKDVKKPDNTGYSRNEVFRA